MTKSLHIQNLSVSVHNKVLLQSVDWCAEQGKINVIIGPNGAGKSTLIKAIAGIVPFEGEVLLHEEPIQKLGRLERAKHLAWVPQSTQVQLPLTVETLVAQGRFPHLGPSGRLSQRDHEVIDRALHDVQCAHLRKRRWTTLSGGEQRRTLIARALATEAKILLLDEPTASLDIEHALRLMELMRSLATQQYTLIPVLHDLNLSRQYADNLLILDQGKAVVHGLPDHVLQEVYIRDVYGVSIQDQAAMRFALIPRGVAP